MDDTLLKLLEDTDLVDLQQLQSMQVSNAKDLELWNDERIKDLGLKPIKAKKLKLFIQKVQEVQREAELKADEEIESLIAAESMDSYDGDNVAVAAYKGALRDVIRLVKEGYNVNTQASQWYMYGALHFMAAVPGGGMAGVRAGGTPAAFASIKPEIATLMMRWLCSKGADVNLGDKGGKTPLHVFFKYGGQIDMFHALVDLGADVNAKMNYDEEWSVLWYCRYYKVPGWEETETLLLQLGATQVPDHL